MRPVDRAEQARRRRGRGVVRGEHPAADDVRHRGRAVHRDHGVEIRSRDPAAGVGFAGHVRRLHGRHGVDRRSGHGDFGLCRRLVGQRRDSRAGERGDGLWSRLRRSCRQRRARRMRRQAATPAAGRAHDRECDESCDSAAVRPRFRPGGVPAQAQGTAHVISDGWLASVARVL